MFDSWAFQAVAASFLMEVYFQQNQNVRLNGVVFMVYRGLAMALMLIPFTPFFPPIDNWQFYVFCILTGLGIAFIDYYYFKAIRYWGAEVVTSIQPLNIGLIFIIWLTLKPSLILFYLQEPLKFVLIILCLIGIMISMVKYNQVKVSRKALRYLLPALLVGALSENINKQALIYGDNNPISAIFYYILVTAVTIGVVNLARYVNSGEPLRILISWKNLKHCWIFIVLILAMTVRNMALNTAVNPAYVAAIIYLYVVWIMLSNNLKACLGKNIRYQQMNKKIVALLLVSVVGLILLTGN